MLKAWKRERERASDPKWMLNSSSSIGWASTFEKVGLHRLCVMPLLRLDKRSRTTAFVSSTFWNDWILQTFSAGTFATLLDCCMIFLDLFHFANAFVASFIVLRIFTHIVILTGFVSWVFWAYFCVTFFNRMFIHFSCPLCLRQC